MSGFEPQKGDFMIFKDNKTYDTLKWIAQILLPAVATLYFALARIWGFPYAEEIVGTIAAVDTFLGVILGISNAQYNKMLDDEEWELMEKVSGDDWKGEE